MTSLVEETAMRHSVSSGFCRTTSWVVTLPISHWKERLVGAASVAIICSLYQNSPISSLLKDTVPSEVPLTVGA